MCVVNENEENRDDVVVEQKYTDWQCRLHLCVCVCVCVFVVWCVCVCVCVCVCMHAVSETQAYLALF